MPTDKAYKETKLIKEGRKQLVTPFKELADWISKEFDVDVLNMYYDLIDNNRPRLDVIFEYAHDKEKFTDTYGAPYKKKTEGYSR